MEGRIQLADNVTIGSNAYDFYNMDQSIHPGKHDIHFYKNTLTGNFQNKNFYTDQFLQMLEYKLKKCNL